jgi:hypothetical protein
MFVYLTWNNLEGKELKTMLEYKKAEIMVEKMKTHGVSARILLESGRSPAMLFPKKS